MRLNSHYHLHGQLQQWMRSSTYVVFKLSLLELFKQYTSVTMSALVQKCTFVAVKQLCLHCGHERVWTSQPHIKDTPAGNLLLSAAILFRWSYTWKDFLLLGHMRVACISDVLLSPASISSACNSVCSAIKAARITGRVQESRYSFVY